MCTCIGYGIMVGLNVGAGVAIGVTGCQWHHDVCTSTVSYKSGDGILVVGVEGLTLGFIVK